MDFSILLDNIRPIGQGFPPKGNCTLLSEKASTSQLHKEIDAYRAEIQSEILNRLGSKPGSSAKLLLLPNVVRIAPMYLTKEVY